jgi:lipopolysaccharide assembly outer membrane protein LptD (OstA)
VGGLFTVTPFAGWRATYYNQRVVGTSVRDTVTIEDTVHDDHVRLQIEGGFDVESRASRVFQLDGAGGLAALQHVIEPRIQVLEIGGMNQGENPQFDLAIDKIGRVSTVAYSLINRINAKTVAGPNQEPVRWEMVRLTLSQVFDMARAVDSRQPFKDIYGDLIFQPTSFLRFRADAQYNIYGLGFRAANTDVTGTYRDVSVTFGSRYDNIVSANFITAEVSAKILANLDGHISVNYDIRNGGSVENRIGFDWRFQCFAIAAEYVNRNKNENQFHFSVNLLGVGQIGTKVGQ